MSQVEINAAMIQGSNGFSAYVVGAEEGKPEAQVWVGDCREILPMMVPEGSVDLVFADPPFNLGRVYEKWDDRMTLRGYQEFTQQWMKEVVRVLRPGGAMWVNAPDEWVSFIDAYAREGLWAERINWCVWHYRFGQHTHEKFISSHSHVLYFVKPGGQRTWNGEAVLEESDRASKYGDPRTLMKSEGVEGKRVPLDVWQGQYWGRVQGNNAERVQGQDNQLPEVYLERVIRATSNAGDTVLDPFLGGGTTSVVGRDLGRRCLGVEVGEDAARRAVERIQRGSVRVGK